MDNLATVLPASQARANWYDLLEDVSKKLKTFVITLRGKAKAIVINPEELDSWRETLEIMADKKLVKELRQSRKEFKQGKYITEEKLFKDLGIKASDL
jgi:prevent-host-death family protein